MNDPRSEQFAPTKEAPLWHNLPISNVLAETRSSDRGLSSAEAEDRLQR